MIERTVILTIESLTGFSPTPSPDPLAASVEDGGSSSSSLPSVYQGYTISAVLSFTVKYSNDGTDIGILPATDVSSSFNYEDYGLTGKKLTESTYEITGTVKNVIGEEFVTLLLDDLTLVNQTPDTLIDFLALIQYKIPFSASPVELVYPFTITAPEDIYYPLGYVDIPYNIYHWVAWDNKSAINRFQNLLSKGTI